MYAQINRLNACNYILNQIAKKRNEAENSKLSSLLTKITKHTIKILNYISYYTYIFYKTCIYRA